MEADLAVICIPPTGYGSLCCGVWRERGGRCGWMGCDLSGSYILIRHNRSKEQYVQAVKTLDLFKAKSAMGKAVVYLTKADDSKKM